MEKMVRFAVYTNDEKTAERVTMLLRAWAEEICVDIHLMMEKGALSDLKVDGCALLLVDSAGLDRQDIMHLQVLRGEYPYCGLVLLADDDRTAIDVYQCHPNALVPKPVTYSGLDAAMERCFSCWQKGLRWLDLPAQHRRVHIPLYQLYYAEASGRSSILYRVPRRRGVAGELFPVCSGGAAAAATLSAGAEELYGAFRRSPPHFRRGADYVQRQGHIRCARQAPAGAGGSGRLPAGAQRRGGVT